MRVCSEPRPAANLDLAILLAAARNPQIVFDSLPPARRRTEVGFLDMEIPLKLGRTCVIKIKNECS
jgi:hypothetical protein